MLVASAHIPSRDEKAIYKRLRAAWANDPERYAVERLGFKPTWQQKQTFAAIAPDGAKVTIRSGHGTGKTGTMAAIVLWFLETRDYPKIPCTAPTSHQLRDVLWAEISKWVRKANHRSAAIGMHPQLWLGSMFRITNDRIYDPSAKGEWFATARTSSKDNPDALQGFHAADIIINEDGTGIEHHSAGGSIMFMVDEAAGVADAVFEVAEGALSSPGSRLLMAANPTRSTGYFADSHRHNRGDFTSLHFRSSDSPLVDKSYREKLVRKWGEGSNVVRVRADGDFPKQDDDALIALEWAEQAIDRQPDEENNADIRLGIDVARFGGDRTVFAVRQGNAVLHLELRSKSDTMETVGRAVQLRRQFNCTAIYPDVTGLGAGVADRLKELNEPVIEVSFGSSAPNRKRHHQANEGEKGQDGQGKLIRDFIWLEMADWFHFDNPSLSAVDRQHAEDLAGEVSAVKYKVDSSGKIVLESKDDTKKRLGFSPDIADALACTFAPGTTDSQFVSIGGRIF